MLGVYTILGVPEHGWTGAQTLLLGAISVALITSFIVRQAKIKNPLMPLRLFRSRNVSGANIVQALTVAGMFGMFFLGALYLQQILDYTPLEVGLAFLPATIAMGFMSLKVSEPAAMRFGPKNTLIPALVLIGIGLLLFARTPVDGNYWIDVAPPMFLFGLGAGLGFPALMTLAMSGATMEDSGLASGLVNTSVQVGGAIGLAVLATLSSQRTDSLTADGSSADAALNGGYHLAYLIGAGLVGVAILLAIFVLENKLPAMMTGEAPETEEGEAAPAAEPALEAA
jgi:predicted MFS family arabinose efflux permease